MKLRALSLLLSFFIFIGFANAKPLPPGTGNSIPANILFLIDKSQSMWSSSTGDGRKKGIRPFNDVTPALNGNYFTVSVDNSGFGYWRPYANEIRNDNSVFGGIDISRAHELLKYLFLQKRNYHYEFHLHKVSNTQSRCYQHLQ